MVNDVRKTPSRFVCAGVETGEAFPFNDHSSDIEEVLGR
jgi:hypothetical protein